MIETLKEAKDKKWQAERAIEQILNDLLVTTGFVPKYVDLIPVTTESNIINVLVTLRVELE